MSETGGSGFSGRPSRGSGPFTVHLADELEVYFNEVAHGRPVGFVASSKWKPPTDIYETEDALVVYMDIAGMRAEDFTVEFADGILTIGGERKPRREGKPHYHAMEVQVGPFERRFRLPVPVDPDSIRASYEHGFLEVRLAKIPARLSGPQSVMVQGLERARLVDVGPAEHWLVAGYETLASGAPEDARTEALKRTVQAQFSRVIDIAPYLGEELHEVLAGITDGSKLADFAAANLDLALPAKAELLSIDDVNRRLERLAELLGQELQVLEVGTQIQEKVKSRLDANQREYVLREQLRVIRQELGEDDGDDELTDLGKRLEEGGLSAEAKKVADRELKRLRQMSPQSAEYPVARTYLEVFARSEEHT